jgi:hypothetical protein
LTIEATCPEGCAYYVDLEECRTPEALLDWIFQLEEKSWVGPQCMREFLSLVDRVLNVQPRLCPGGQRRVISLRDLGRIVENA